MAAAELAQTHMGANLGQCQIQDVEQIHPHTTPPTPKFRTQILGGVEHNDYMISKNSLCHEKN